MVNQLSQNGTPPIPIPGNVSVAQNTQVSRLTTGTMFGGQNEQAMNRGNNNNGRSVSTVITNRKINTVKANHPEPQPNTKAYNECDTNGDTSCLGTNFVVLSYTTRTANVYAYEKTYKPIEGVPIVSGATAWDDPVTQQTHILVVNKALYYGTKLDHSLFNPNQFRHYGIGFWDNPYDKERGLKIDVNNDITIPMYSKGTKVLFQTRAPTAIELNTCPHIELTSPREWNPNDIQLGEATSMNVRLYDSEYRESCLQSQQSHNFYEYIDPTDDEALIHTVEPSYINLKERLISKISTSCSNISQVQYDHQDIPEPKTFISSERHAKLTAESISEKFGIGLERARATIRATTQRGVRSAILPISRRYRAD